MLRPPRPSTRVDADGLEMCPECAGAVVRRTYPRDVGARTVTMLDVRCGACGWTYVRVEPAARPASSPA